VRVCFHNAAVSRRSREHAVAEHDADSGSPDGNRLAQAELDASFQAEAATGSAQRERFLPEIGGLVAMATSDLGGGPAKRGKAIPTSLAFTRDSKCVFCEYVLQQVEARLRLDPFLNYVGAPEDYPFADTGSIFGSKDAVQTQNSRRSYPKAPIPRSQRGIIRGMNVPPPPPPPPFVTPPRDRLLPSQIAAGKGQAQDATVAIAQATLAKAAQSAMRTFALPGANGATWEGGLATLAGKDRPDVLAPVDPNELLAAAGVSGWLAGGQAEAGVPVCRAVPLAQMSACVSIARRRAP